MHNTLSVDGLEQMTRAGRFLYLDWAQASPVERTRAADGSWERLSASHHGYRRLGVTHQRQVTAFKDGRWLVEDTLQRRLPPCAHRPPALAAARLSLGSLTLPRSACTSCSPPRLVWSSSIVHAEITPLQPMLVRAGELLLGSGEAAPTWGWTSPTYGDKIPALALLGVLPGALPLQITHGMDPA